MQNWKKTGAALLVATLTVSGAGYAWANSNYDTVNINDVNKNTQETSSASETAQVTPTQAVAATSTTVATAQTTTNKDLPVELATEKLVGLVKAYESASNDDAKAAILNVINRVIAEYETTQKDIYQKKAPELTAAIDRLIVLFKDYQQAPNADKKAAIIAQVKTVVTELQNYLAKQEDPKENTPPVIVPPIKDKDKDKADRDKKKAELEKKKAEEKAAKEAAKAAAEAKRAQEKAAAEAKRAQEKAEREAAKATKQAEIEAANKAKAAELAAKKAAQEQKKAEQKPKHPNGKDENRHNKGPKHNQQPKHDKHQKQKGHHNKHDHKHGHHGQGKNDRN
ncbi:hypothetical protein [Psychrobacillus sp. MER TA 171]|uniref:hypothetical protein n=1 Tax=Psychrobacillus sp. MER TA 171 TaxID=2939577 RepID=UPI00203A6B94|nr:hypothetical protein [Psychrobacillus sp. MER TA 171]MCM3356475.1 hypothetical protein [Psychrobacillus sp. MER TA 171]